VKKFYNLLNNNSLRHFKFLSSSSVSLVEW
jgi:hypothetical protein